MSATETETETEATTPVATPKGGQRGRRPRTPGEWGAVIFLAAVAVLWLVPLVAAFYTSLRPFEDTAVNGYFSIASTLSFENYTTAWNVAGLPKYFWNTMIITIPAVIITLFLSTMVAYGLSRFSFRFNVAMLILVTAGNLLPQQTLIVPLFRMFLEIPAPGITERGILYDSYLGIVLIHVAFQMGFVTFVLSNYMKTLPKALDEAAMVDGAGVWTRYWRVILPLSRPPLAALAVLQFTWIYNDFFWARVLMPSGDKRPITSALDSLQGLFFTDNNLIAAGSILAAIPALVVFVLLQKQFVRGLTLGSTKG